MKTILLVEDDLEFANKCIEQLLLNKYEVKFASNSEKAKHIFIENNIDFVIVDLMLPPSFGIEGVEFYRYVKSKNDNIPAIFMTTKSFKTTEIVAEAMKLGALDFLDKETDVFIDKLIFSLKNFEVKSPNSNKSNMKNTLFIIIIYLFLFIILTGFLLYTSYLINLLGLPFVQSFLIITTVAISVIIIIIASQLRYDSKISEKTWLEILKSRIVNFPQLLLDN